MLPQKLLLKHPYFLEQVQLIFLNNCQISHVIYISVNLHVICTFYHHWFYICFLRSLLKCWNNIEPNTDLLHLERYLTMIHHWQAPEMSYISSLVHLSRAFWQCCKANFSREYYSLNLLGKKKKNKLAYISTENYASNFTFNPWKNYLLQVTLTINCTLIL